MLRSAPAALVAASLALGALACAPQGHPIDTLHPTPTPTPTPDPMMMMQEPPPVTGPSFYKEVQPILRDKCESCHHTGGLGPFSVSSYAEAKPYAAAMAADTATKRMPPWGAQVSDECRPRFGFRDDMSLTDAQIKTIGDWAAAGAPEGDAANALAPQEFPAIGLENANLTLQPQNEFVASGDRDQFRCFVIDPHWAAQTYVDGVYFQPGNASIVHHAILFLDPNRESLTKAGPDGSYDCFGGPFVSQTGVVLAWAPGVTPLDVGQGGAFAMTANTMLVLQVHYHPAGGTNLHDKSTVQLRTTTQHPTYLMQLALIGNFSAPMTGGDGLLPDPDDRNGTPEFRIPAGATDHEERQQLTLPATLQGYPLPDLKVVGVGTHMHYVGTDMKIELEHPTPKMGEPSSECLLQTPRWDFNWQRGYAYDASVTEVPEYRPGDKLHLTCKYNNTTSNPHVLLALRQQGISAPQDVVLGEQTLDEMCLAVLAVMYPNPYPF